jgi:hypothetical protein
MSAVAIGPMPLVSQGTASSVQQDCVTFTGTCDCPSGVCDCHGGWHCYSLGWDIDWDGAIDFCVFPGSDCPSGCEFAMTGDVAWPLEKGAIVGPDLEWTSLVNWFADAGGCYSGPGCDGTGPYIGLRFTNETGTHYGWMLGPFGSHAYETDAGMAIAAGSGAPPAAGDITGDGLVNGVDLGLLLGAWGDCIPHWCCPADFAPDGGDGVVGSEELGMLLSNWSS